MRHPAVLPSLKPNVSLEMPQKRLTVNPSNSVLGATSLIHKHSDDSPVHRDMRHWSFIVISSGGRPKIEEYRGEISTMEPVKINETAEVYLGKTVTDSVVTVSAYLDDLVSVWRIIKSALFQG
ncbi:hypothetical protein AAHC03_054 [Spirometra sp. Aus1]